MISPSLPRWLVNLPFRRKLALMVGVPSLVALLGMALSLARVLETYRRSEVLDHANTSFNHLLLAAATQAKERGFTSTALADPAATRTAAQVAALRTAGDDQLAAALAAATPALRGNRVLEASFLRLQEARRERDRARAAVDETLVGRGDTRTAAAEPAFVQNWFEAQTRLILAESEFGKALFIAQNPFELVLQYNGDIKARCFLASEFAGRERAQLARAIASGRPIPPPTLAELQRWRGVVEENLAAIAQLRANPLMPESIVNRVGEMELAFLGDYERLRRAVYEAGTTGGPYPLGADAWIEEATRAIDRILAVSTQIGVEAARISRQQEAASRANLLFIAGLLGALLLALGASALVGRGLIRRVGELRAGARRVAAGDLDHPVPAGGNDELGALSDAFNAMTAEVRAGLEGLRAEKLSVEAKVHERTLELSAANAHLRTLDEEKNAFLGMCSHDLKNPLGAILSLADFVRETPGVPPEARAHARDIHDSAQFMLGLVVNLLNLTAIEAGRFPLEPETLDLRTLAAQAVDAYRERARHKRIDLDLLLPTPTPDVLTPAATTAAGRDDPHPEASPSPELVVGDRRALTQVLDNLVSNAVKYSPLGGRVRVGITRGNERLCLLVADSGPGLSAEDQGKLFGKFARLSSRPTGGEHSSGLGLSIVKRLTEAMGGRVGCESELGRGATFRLELPAATAVTAR